MNKAEYDALVKTIEYHMDRYYNQDAPEITDEAYDGLMRQLKAAEREHPEWITPDSPSQKIGGTAKREAGVKVEHNVPMLSIEDVFTLEEVTAWVRKVQAVHADAAFSVEEKIDGLSMTLRYRDGALELAETRGDGRIGEDVTVNARVIPDVPHALPEPLPYLEVRGEVFMSHEDFERFNQQQEENGRKPAANPRNLAAGTLRQLNAAVTRERGLRYFAFNIQQGPGDLSQSHTAGLDRLAALGLPVVRHRRCASADEVLAAIAEIGEARGGLPYDIDGAVVKIDQTAYRADFPAGSKYSSGHIAYKYPPEERPVVLDEVEETVGRTGRIGFIGHVHDQETGKPARLAGTNVSRVTLHNQDYMREMKIGLGGVYLLKKAGDIIPRISGVVREPDKIYEVSSRCPVCGAPLVREEDTADIRCENVACPAQRTRTISWFTSLSCMNIMGLGETLVEALVEQGFLESYADIYRLKDHREELIEKGTIGKEKNTDKLLAAIEASKANEPARLLAGLGIRNVGRATAQTIMRHYASIGELRGASVEELTAIQDIGATTAACIREFFDNPVNARVLEELAAAGVNMAVQEESRAPQVFEGLTFVITGTLPTLGRREAQELIERHGGKCAGSVSKKTDYLVAGEAAGSKLDKARTLGTKILTEAELLGMIPA